LAAIGLIVAVKGMKELGLEEYMMGTNINNKSKKYIEVADCEGFS
jgi:hypothetical protein